MGSACCRVDTALAADKLTQHRRARFAALPAPWEALAGLEVSGYEIRHGTSATRGAAAALPDGLGFVAGPLLGVYLHGLFEDPAVVAALLGVRPERSLDDALDQLADAVGAHLDVDALLEEIS